MASSPGGVEVGRVSVRVLPDTSRLFVELEADLRKIEARTELSINATIDNARLDAEARAAVDQAQLAAGDIHIKADVDTSQVREAESALSGATSSAQGFSSGLGAILSAVIILGPALIPLTAAVAALGAALVAPLAIVGGGLTVFGLIAGFTVSETNKQLKAIDQLDTKLSGLTKGTKEYADTAAQLHAAQAALTPAQTAFAAALDRVKASFDSIPKAIVLKPITEGLNLLAHVLPLVEPILRAVSGVITDIIGQFDKAARSAGFKTFVDAFAKQLGPDLRAFATIAGNVFSGLFGLFGAFNQQLSGSVLSSLETLTQKFQDWGQTVGQSKGFRSFVDYIKRVGPQVADALGQIALATIAIVTAFAPIGSTVLGVVGQLAGAIAQIPAGTLAALATALVAVVAASKLLAPISLAFELLASPVGLAVAAAAGLAGAFVVLFQHSKPLRNILGDLADFFKTELLPKIKDAADDVVPALKSALHDLNQTLRDNKPFLEVLGKVLLVLGSAVVVGGIEQFVAVIKILGKAIQFQVGFWHLWADAILLSLRITVAGLTVFAKVVLTAFGVIVDGAAAAFGWIPGIGGKVKGAQDAFHRFSDGVLDSLTGVGDKLKSIQDQIDGKHVLHVTVDDLQAIKSLEALQAFRFADKTINVTTNMRERAVGPGGGIGQPSPNNGGGAGGGSGSGSSRSMVHIDHVTTNSKSDLIRQADSLSRGRSGGGVALAGSNG